FGFAKVDEQGALTQAGVAVGTGEDMSPEQAVNDPVDAPADLYAPRVLMAPLFTRRPPLAAADASQMLAPHPLQEPPPPPTPRRPPRATAAAPPPPPRPPPRRPRTHRPQGPAKGPAPPLPVAGAPPRRPPPPRAGRAPRRSPPSPRRRRLPAQDRVLCQGGRL